MGESCSVIIDDQLERADYRFAELGGEMHFMARRSERAKNTGAEQQVGDEREDPCQWSLLRADPLELATERFGAPPHGDRFDATRPDFAHGQLALDPRLVEQLERSVHGRGAGSVTEAMCDQ